MVRRRCSFVKGVKHTLACSSSYFGFLGIQCLVGRFSHTGKIITEKVTHPLFCLREVVRLTLSTNSAAVSVEQKDLVFGAHDFDLG